MQLGIHCSVLKGFLPALEEAKTLDCEAMQMLPYRRHHVPTPEEMAAYLEACIEEADGDATFIAKALGDIARAKGMSQLARDTQMGRESLYKALSGDGNPSFATILKVMRALGLQLHAKSTHLPA